MCVFCEGGEMEQLGVGQDSDEIQDDKVTRLPLEREPEAERRRLHIHEISVDEAENPETVGSALRAARLRLGEDIRTVAGALKIRQVHLQALEDCRYDDLPGRPYALGFVRSYAAYLGLDADHAIQRYKEETTPKEPVEDLDFPEPDVEDRMPQGSLVVIALLLVGAIIGGLYLSQAVDRMLAERANGGPLPDDDFSVAEQGAADPAPITPILPGGRGLQPAGEASEGANLSQPVQPLGPLPPQVFGDLSDDVRITIHALDNAWLRVDDPVDGAVLIQTALRAGDSFRVPNRPGLVMSARNAGGLEIFVDGASVGVAGQGMLEEKLLEAESLLTVAN
jgi:cytoskeleton protein RodZ